MAGEKFSGRKKRPHYEDGKFQGMDPGYAVTSVMRILLDDYVTGKRTVCFVVTEIVSDHDDLNSHTHTFIVGYD